MPVVLSQMLIASSLQVLDLVGPLFCLSWCARKQWLLVGGKAQLHVYNVCFQPMHLCRLLYAVMYMLIFYIVTHYAASLADSNVLHS